jgi:A/G-specific adenine glycosylase
LKTIPFFAKILLDWFEENQRNMPWRGETDPYKIWVSEIILQQTRVNQGWAYYERFVERFPDVKSLAEAPLQEVLHVWRGLGYYSRARNMHTAAQQIVENHQSVFPRNYSEIKKLKGVGNYTAAAISSIAFQLPYPTVDGNVLRVISRIFGMYDDISQQKTVSAITGVCQRLMDNKKSGNFNQALMELGAIQCTPRNPKCKTCPFAVQCIALAQEHIHILPVKSLKIRIKERYLHYFIFLKDFKTIIEQRKENDIWKNLYQFPLIETQIACEKISKKELLLAGIGNCKPVFLKEVKHKLTHQHLSIRFYVINNFLPEIKKHWLKISVNHLHNYPFPVALKDLLHHQEPKISFHQQIIEPLQVNFQQFENNRSFCIDEVYYSYHQLSLRIGAITNVLKNIKDRNIAIVAHDHIDTYAAIVACWFLHKYYIPLNPLFPIERNLQILEQTKAAVVIEMISDSVFCNVETFILASELKDAAIDWNEIENHSKNDDEIAYLLFTSGSTGMPKGVPITRLNLASFMAAHKEIIPDLSENDRCLQMFDLSFDMSIASFLFPLLHGACVYTLPAGAIKYQYIYSLLEKHTLTYLALVPSVLHYLQNYFNEIYLPTVRYCLFAGEALLENVVNRWHLCIPNAIQMNLLGPTEGTIYCTHHRVTFNTAYRNGIVSVGKELPRVCFEVFDDNLKPISAGETGELCLAGAQLTPGYFNNEPLNKEKFFTKRNKGKLIRFYKTGDLGIKNNDGTIDFIGRKDTQVKIAGFRVELSEIEFYARKAINHTANAIAITKLNLLGNHEIILFYETAEQSTELLFRYLQEKLPYYMIPKEIRFMPQFPLNSNGKIDKEKLLCQ